MIDHDNNDDSNKKKIRIVMWTIKVRRIIWVMAIVIKMIITITITITITTMIGIIAKVKIKNKYKWLK